MAKLEKSRDFQRARSSMTIAPDSTPESVYFADCREDQ